VASGQINPALKRHVFSRTSVARIKEMRLEMVLKPFQGAFYVQDPLSNHFTLFLLKQVTLEF